MRVGRINAVLESVSGAFDVTVPPGEDVQAAVNRCPPGGSVLLLPGTHNGPLVLRANKEVHVFGRGQATLRTAAGFVVSSEAVNATLDGLVIRHEAESYSSDCGVGIRSGRLRLHACIITSAQVVCVVISGAADPTVASCKCVPCGLSPPGTVYRRAIIMASSGLLALYV